MDFLCSRPSPSFRLALRQAAETVKIALSRSDQVDLTLNVEGKEIKLGLSLSELDTASSYLVSRLWPPLENLAKDTRMQLGGKSPTTLPMWGNSLDRHQSNPVMASVSVKDIDTKPSAGTASGRAFSVFPEAQGGTRTSEKYVAPPRRPTGVVLVGAATRMPSVLRFITHVTGLEPAGGVDPELVVALGAAVHAGVLQVKPVDD